MKKNISLAKLRDEQRNKKTVNRDSDKKGGKRFGRFRRGKKVAGGKKGGKFGGAVKQDKDSLDKDLERYMVAGGHTEHVKSRLDLELIEYMAESNK